MDIKTAQSLSTHEEISVRELAKEYLAILSSPHYDTYQIVKDQIHDWNEQLKVKKGEKKFDKKGKEVGIKGRIDIFADADNKDFDRALKYFSEITHLHEVLDKLRSRFTPEENKKAEEAVTNSQDQTDSFESVLSEIKNSGKKG